MKIMEKIEIVEDIPLATKNTRHIDCCYYHMLSDICFNDSLPVNTQQTGYIPKCKNCKHYDNDPWDGLTYKQVFLSFKNSITIRKTITPKQKEEARKYLQEYLKQLRIQMKELKEREKKKKQAEIFQILN